MNRLLLRSCNLTSPESTLNTTDEPETLTWRSGGIEDSLEEVDEILDTEMQPTYAVVGSEAWRTTVVITANGATVAWTIQARRPKRVHLGYAMGCVKGDDSEIDWDWKGMMVPES